MIRKRLRGPVQWPPVVVAPLHTEHRTHHCKNCKAHLRDCKCPKPEPFEMEDWSYKGVLKLPDTHPDSPNYKSA